MRNATTPRIAVALLFLLLLLSPAAARNDEAAARRVDALLEEGIGKLEAGDAAAAAAPLRKALELVVDERVEHPRAAEVPYQLARCELRLGAAGDPARLGRVRDLLRESERLDPTFAPAYYLYGAVGADAERWRDAVVGFEMALRLGHREREARVHLAQALFFFGIEKAEEPRVVKDVVIGIFEAAARHFEALAKDEGYAEPDRRSFRDLLVKTLMNLAAMRQRANDLPEAEAVLEKLIGLEPENYLHYYNLGLVLGSGRRWDRALLCHRKALELSKDPDWIDPYPMMAHIYSQQGRPEEAEKLFLAYLERYPDHWRCRFLLGEHYVEQDRLDLAERAFRRCLEITWNRPAAVFKLSQILRRRGRPAEAEKWLELYQALDARTKKR